MRAKLLLAAATFLSASLVARADVVGPGSYSGTQLDTTGKTISGTSISYTDSVYADTTDNPYCSGCLDFVIQITDRGISDGVTSVNTTGFAGYSLSFAYEDDGDMAPTAVTTNKSGNKVTFDISLLDDQSDSLIIYTNATEYGDGGLTINYEGTDPPAFAPSGPAAIATTPEPSSLVLLGTGLMGAVGVLRKRLA